MSCRGSRRSLRRPILDVLAGPKKMFFRRTQEGRGGLRGESPAAFPKAGPIFQQPFFLPENAQTLTGIAFCAAGKSVQNFSAASKFAGKLFQQRISDSHSLLKFSEFWELLRGLLFLRPPKLPGTIDSIFNLQFRFSSSLVTCPFFPPPLPQYIEYLDL